jgi:hypothetical protein
MQLLHDAGITHVSYVLILYSIAFIFFLCKLTDFALSPPFRLLFALPNLYCSRQYPSTYLHCPRLARLRQTLYRFPFVKHHRFGSRLICERPLPLNFRGSADQ